MGCMVDNSVNRTNVSPNISRGFYRKTVVLELFFLDFFLKNSVFDKFLEEKHDKNLKNRLLHDGGFIV